MTSKANYLSLALLITTMQATAVFARSDYVAVTIDNDLFGGNDNGYSNGFFVSMFDVGKEGEDLSAPDFWVSPLLWSLPDGEVDGAVNAYSLGQTLTTPSDITIPNPSPDDLPYSAMLVLTNTYLTATSEYADTISTSIGLVGPSAVGEEVQKFVHDIIGADEPQGWDTQLGDEIVFQVSRGRT